MFKIAVTILAFASALVACGSDRVPVRSAKALPQPVQHKDDVPSNLTPTPTWDQYAATLCGTDADELSTFTTAIFPANADIFAATDYFTRATGTLKFPGQCARKNKKNAQSITSSGQTCPFQYVFTGESAYTIRIKFAGPIRGDFKAANGIPYVSFGDLAPTVEWLDNNGKMLASGPVKNMCRRLVNGELQRDILIEFQDGKMTNYFRFATVK